MIKDEISQVLTVAAYEVRKYLRSRRLIGMVVILGLIIGLILGLPPALGSKYPSQPDNFVGTFAGFTGILVILCGTLFAADALVSEHEKRTGYFLFPNPVRREVLVLGKLLASLFTSAAVLTLYYLVATIAALAATGAASWEIGLSYAYALAYTGAVVGIAYVLSSVLRSTVAATVLTFFLFLLIFNIIGALLFVGKVDPWFIPTSASGIISNVLAPPSEGPPGPFRQFVPDAATSLLVFAAYFVAGSILSILLFRRRELSS